MTSNSSTEIDHIQQNNEQKENDNGLALGDDDARSVVGSEASWTNVSEVGFPHNNGTIVNNFTSDGRILQLCSSLAGSTGNSNVLAEFAVELRMQKGLYQFLHEAEVKSQSRILILEKDNATLKTDNATLMKRIFELECKVNNGINTSQNADLLTQLSANFESLVKTQKNLVQTQKYDQQTISELKGMLNECGSELDQLRSAQAQGHSQQICEVSSIFPDAWKEIDQIKSEFAGFNDSETIQHLKFFNSVCQYSAAFLGTPNMDTKEIVADFGAVEFDNDLGYFLCHGETICPGGVEIKSGSNGRIVIQVLSGFFEKLFGYFRTTTIPEHIVRKFHVDFRAAIELPAWPVLNEAVVDFGPVFCPGKYLVKYVVVNKSHGTKFNIGIRFETARCTAFVNMTELSFERADLSEIQLVENILQNRIGSAPLPINNDALAELATTVKNLVQSQMVDQQAIAQLQNDLSEWTQAKDDWKACEQEINGLSAYRCRCVTMPYKSVQNRPDLKGQFPCSVCGKIFCLSTSVRRHHFQAHLKSYNCTLCNQEISSNDKSHMYRFHQISRKFICQCCNWAFPDRSSYNIHKKIMSKSGKSGNVAVPARNSVKGEPLEIGMVKSDSPFTRSIEVRNSSSTLTCEDDLNASKLTNILSKSISNKNNSATFVNINNTQNLTGDGNFYNKVASTGFIFPQTMFSAANRIDLLNKEKLKLLPQGMEKSIQNMPNNTVPVQDQTPSILPLTAISSIFQNPAFLAQYFANNSSFSSASHNQQSPNSTFDSRSASLSDTTTMSNSLKFVQEKLLAAFSASAMTRRPDATQMMASIQERQNLSASHHQQPEQQQIKKMRLNNKKIIEKPPKRVSTTSTSTASKTDEAMDLSLLIPSPQTPGSQMMKQKLHSTENAVKELQIEAELHLQLDQLRERLSAIAQYATNGLNKFAVSEAGGDIQDALVDCLKNINSLAQI